MICDGTILIPGVNDLQHSNPELAAELSPNNELAADQIFYKARFPDIIGVARSAKMNTRKKSVVEKLVRFM